MNTLRYCKIKSFNNILSRNRNQTIGYVINGFGHQRNYSKEKDSCCKEISQTEGRTVEPWPKTQKWPCKFPDDPQPPNYDPYKIRCPDVVVPPLPPSNVKEAPIVAKSEKFGLEESRSLDTPSNAIKSLFQKTHMVHPDNWKPKPLNQMQKSNRKFSQENTPRLGYHGRDIYKYAFHEPWNPLDRLTLLAQAEKEESSGRQVTACDANKGAT